MSHRISFNPISVTLVLAEISILLILLSLEGLLFVHINELKSIPRIVQLFNVGEEYNIPTLFSAFLLFFASLLLALIAVLEKQRNASEFLYWGILSFGFLVMTADELCCFHEILTTPMQVLLGGSNLGLLYFAWVVPGIVLVLALALFFIRFWLRLPSNTKFIFLISAMIYLGGCIGFEMIGGRYVEIYGRANFMYIILQTIEESLEMAGVIIFIWSLLTYISDHYEEIRIVFDKVRRDT